MIYKERKQISKNVHSYRSSLFKETQCGLSFLSDFNQENKMVA